MNRIHVESNNLYSVGYVYLSMVLEIEFIHDYSIYHYYDVPYKLYTELMDSNNKGSFFWKFNSGTFEYYFLVIGLL